MNWDPEVEAGLREASAMKREALEQALRVARRLVAEGLTPSEIAQRVRRSPSWVRMNRHRLG